MLILKRYNYFLKKFLMNNTSIFYLIWLNFRFQKNFEKEIVFKSSVLAWSGTESGSGLSKNAGSGSGSVLSQSGSTTLLQIYTVLNFAGYHILQHTLCEKYKKIGQ
jgi:hypothetical protein